MLRLRDLREDKDMTQEQIAKLLNVTQAAYSLYELEKRGIDYELLIKLAKFYNTSIDYIVGITNEIKPYPPIKK